MARIAAVLGTLLRLSWREISTDHSIAGNNLLLIVFLLGSGGTQAIVFPVVVLGGLFLTAMSVHPLSKVPTDRLRTWPLTAGDRVVLQVGGVWLNPAVLILLPLLLVASLRLLAGYLLIGVISLQLAAGLISGRLPHEERAGLRIWTPSMPGRLGELIRKDTRQLLSYLDVWVSFAFCLGATIYRFTAEAPEPEAYAVISSLAAVIMGTSAQCLFGSDGAAGFTRYQLLPLRGWQVLGAKGAAWLLLLSLQTVLLSPIAAIAAGLVALAVGHHRSIRQPLMQKRWRFTNGSLLMLGLAQTTLSIGAGLFAARINPVAVLACALFYAISLVVYGHRWERRAT
ncbi:MAG: hypothetical protein O3A53_01300 [Acidobacteria bacterium]|nr:hypothetical protein [Acidobacteriota bacterium]MDA1233417.1 hypothetical protein [Acidobacteriota bacterium]